MTALPIEFDRIARHFRPLAGPGSLDLTDDAAVFTPPPGRELLVTADAMVEGVHFLPGTAPGLVARKLLRVNLSDLAAMGATPLGYLVTISVPREFGDAWFAGFAAGLAQDQAEFGIALLGGDTTQTPGPLSLSLTAIGHGAPGQALRRSGARAGDEVWVTGTIGDGVLGLGGGAGRAGRSGRLPEGALRPADAAPGAEAAGLGPGGDGRLGRAVPGPRPYLPGERRGGAGAGRPGAAIPPGPGGGAGLARCCPGGWRRL